MSRNRFAAALLGLTMLGATTAAAQARGTMIASARVEDVRASRKSLQAVTELAQLAVSQIERQATPSGRRATPHGVVTLRASTCGNDACSTFGLITTITYW